MGKQSEHISRGGDRSAIGWLLFAVATTMAVLFLNVGNAYGQDAATSTNGTDGSAEVGSGDATSTGNAADTDSGQAAAPSGGSPTVTRQSSTVNNTGVAIANTGGNAAAGNVTNGDLDADNDQDADANSIASNSGRASNSSNGSANISTGDATAIGNASSTDVHQESNVYAGGGAGAPIIVIQDNETDNTGVGIANSGLNAAVGNFTNGDFDADNDQDADADGSISSNNAASTNSSNGSAGIDTGDANATGNASATGVTQVANAANGGGGGGLGVTSQRSDVDNVGVGIANSGLNVAAGNVTLGDYDAAVDQDSASGNNGPPGDDDLAIASNDGVAANYSNGTAAIRTGDAWAVGNHSETHITQQANTYLDGVGFVVTVQDANVNNIGVGLANSGLNAAVGNLTLGDFDADVDQEADADADGDGDDTAIAGNFGSAINKSDGTAGISTGDAWATGNWSRTGIDQSANAAIDGSAGFIVPVQRADVNNVGVGIANSGVNLALGNVTAGDFDADVDQAGAQGADADANGDGDDVAIAGNFGEAINKSNGTAGIRTGDATATGNDSETWVGQSSSSYIGDGAVGFIVPVQTVTVNNIGVGIANSGINGAVGNLTLGDFDADVDQEADADTDGDGDDIATAGNFGSALNSSNGTAGIDTGDATATGNKSATAVSQTSNNFIGAGGVGGGGLGNDPFIVSVQSVDVNNIGVGLANSGVNGALGNLTVGDFDADVDQGGGAEGADADADGDGDDTAIAGNFGTASNNSDGTAEISTGDACAAGNNSTTYVTQYAGSGIDGVGFIVPVQTAEVNNIGVGIANSGFNGALGNLTVGDFDADVDQESDATADGDGDDLATASNDGVASNWSNGTARISTGDANAEGNRSATGISQTSNAFLAGVGFVVPVQAAVVNNIGVAVGNSGVNAAVGNITVGDFDADVDQSGAQGADADATGDGDDVAIASNTAAATNSSDGTATIETGDACAAGNVAANVVNQNVAVFAPFAGFIVPIQVAAVNNIGVGIANSGFNAGLGNLTVGDLDADVDQEADADATGDGDDLAIANNAARASNSTDGSSSIRTGHADATGNWATNGVSQEAWVFGNAPFTLVVQAAPINNFGVGIANTGLNLGLGNLTLGDLDADADQDADADSGDDDFAIANNIADTSNSTDGSSNVRTGNATATGNQASNLSCQATNGVCPDLAFPPLPEPLCPCHKKPEVPEVPPTPPTPPVPPVVGVPGEQLPVTGSPLAAQAALGLLLVALGSMLKRRRRQLA